VRVGEARARLRLELVAGEVLRAERERLAQVGLEVGGALARDPVDEIERDVVKSASRRCVDARRTSSGRPALEHLEQAGLEALRAERDRVHAAAAAAPRAPASRSPGSPRPSPPPPAAARASSRSSAAAP
jgi:hypothetical protein